MAIAYQNNGNGTATLTLTYTANRTKLDAVLLDAAHALFDLGYGNHGTVESPRVWIDLSQLERLNLIDEFFKREIVDKAKAYHIRAGEESARATAIAELGNYDI